MFPNRDQSLKVNYSKCVLCQKSKNDGVSGDIINPMKSRNITPQRSYELIVEILTKADRNCALPFYLSRLLKNENVASELQHNKAIWHKACRLKYSKKFDTSEQESTSAFNISFQDAGSPLTKTLLPTGQKICLFCDNSVIDPKFHNLSKITTYEKIKESSQELQDDELLNKLGTSINDLKTVNYHLQCITRLYNRSRLNEKQTSKPDAETELKKEAYFEICLHIERTLLDDYNAIFCLVDLKDFFVKIMDRLGISAIKKNSLLSHLNIEILKTFPLLQEFKFKGATFFAKQSAISSAIAYKWHHINNDDDFVFSKAAKIVRKDMLGLQPRNDNNLIQQEESISKKLKKLMTMILEGNKVGKKSKSNQAVLSVCQIIQYNTRKRSGPSGLKKRHQIEHETPLTR